MSDEHINQELSLDDIFSRARKESDLKSKKRDLPFKFLDSYTREDKSIFFGRDIETDDIFRKFYSGKLLLIYGKSGTGESSIINCGLISRIPEEDLFAINVRCGKKAYENFISEIKKYSNSTLDKPLELLEDVFYEYSKPVALIFDQFEEIFILSDEDLDKLGRIGNVLSDFLDEQLRSMPHGDMGEALLKTMISTDGTKKLLTVNEMSAALMALGHSLDHNIIEEILRHFIDVRLITDKDEQGFYELRHDAIAWRIYEKMSAGEKELIEIRAFLDNSYKIYGQRRVLLSENDLKYIALYENKLILNDSLKDFIKT